MVTNVASTIFSTFQRMGDVLSGWTDDEGRNHKMSRRNFLQLRKNGGSSSSQENRMLKHPLLKIVSGGQTGVDRAALDAAIHLEIEHGGWCPKGRRAEDGKISTTYKLTETLQRDYTVRTEKNVIDSDGTLILFRSRLTGGTELTWKLARKHNRPVLCIDLEITQVEISDNETAVDDKLIQFLNEHNIQVLNIAGPRESNAPGIARQVEQFLVRSLS